MGRIGDWLHLHPQANAAVHLGSAAVEVAGQAIPGVGLITGSASIVGHLSAATPEFQQSGTERMDAIRRGVEARVDHDLHGLDAQQRDAYVDSMPAFAGDPDRPANGAGEHAAKLMTADQQHEAAPSARLEMAQAHAEQLQAESYASLDSQARPADPGASADESPALEPAATPEPEASAPPAEPGPSITPELEPEPEATREPVSQPEATHGPTPEPEAVHEPTPEAATEPSTPGPEVAPPPSAVPEPEATPLDAPEVGPAQPPAPEASVPSETGTQAPEPTSAVPEPEAHPGQEPEAGAEPTTPEPSEAAASEPTAPEPSAAAPAPAPQPEEPEASL